MTIMFFSQMKCPQSKYEDENVASLDAFIILFAKEFLHFLLKSFGFESRRCQVHLITKIAEETGIKLGNGTSLNFCVSEPKQ